MSLRKTGLSVLAALSALCLGGTSRADFITQTFTHSSQTVPYTYNFAADQFDPTLGALTSVVITETSNVTGEVDVLNITNSAQAFTGASASVPVTLSGPAGLSVAVTASTPGQDGTIAANTISTPLTLPGETISVSASATITALGALAAYIGTGTNSLSFSFDAGAGTYSGSAAQGVFFGAASADADITITYNYTPATHPVPEPTGYALLGLGGVVGLFSRQALRRKAESL